MDSLNESIDGAVCIDEEVFFGPISDRERKIRENFGNDYKNENKISVESQKVIDNDISKNDSLYVSFSVEDSKFDSFEDSLNEDIDKKSHGTKHTLLRKSLDKLKMKKHGFYDSLEDVCSLASNIEKCSISCDAENNSDKQHIIEDSLRNPSIAVMNKSCCVSEQIHFDDDSLAIVELENTFDDSLEEFNVLSSIEIEEINEAEIINIESHNVASKAELNPVCLPRNLFETSVEIIYEKREAESADPEESFGDKNIFYDSLSNSDFKDILKDSLEEPVNCDSILKHSSGSPGVKTQKIEQFNEFSSVEIKNNEVKSESDKLKVEQNSDCTSKELFETSVQIIIQKGRKTNVTDQELSDDLNKFEDSLSNSDRDIQKKCCDENVKPPSSSNASNINSEKMEKLFVKPDMLDNSVQIIDENLQNCHRDIEKKCCDENVKPTSDFKATTIQTEKLEELAVKPDIFDNSVQIIYENFLKFQELKEVDFPSNENISSNAANFDCNVLQDFQENLNNDSDIKTIETEGSSNSQYYSISSGENVSGSSSYLDTNANENYTENDEKFSSVLTKSDLPVSNIDSSNFNNEAFTVDSCHLKLLNENLNVDKDLKFQLQIEVTVGDRKCRIAADDVKLLSASSFSSKVGESSSLTSPPSISENCINEEKSDIVVSCSSKVLDKNVENISSADSNENTSCDNFNSVDTTNVTQRIKSSVPELFTDSDFKFDFSKNGNNVNLLQALDLHDISASFLNETIQSDGQAVPLHLTSREQELKEIQMCLFRNESKENIAESDQCFEEKKYFYSPNKETKRKLSCCKSRKSLQKSPSLKETKKIGTKIPVRKVENFAVPVVSSSKFAKQFPSSQSAEKVKKCHHSHTSHSAEKKNPSTAPNKTPHFCKVRNTIFSKVPQITPSKKYMNIQSPVAQYIRNTPGSAKTPAIDPVLRDCMNHMHLESGSPSHLQHVTKVGSGKSTKRKP